MTTLYRKNALGIGVWSIWSNENVIHISHSSTLDGSPVHHTEVVEVGKQGRTLREQVNHRIASRISKQRDKGYVDSIDEAAKGAFNQLGLTPPMLAQVYAGSTGGRDAFIQRKLNGLRCLLTRQDGQLIAYSRRGKLMPTIHEIIEEAAPLIGEGDTFDGELYVHGTSLQTIQSWVKRRQPNTGRLIYAVYDQISKEGFADRYSDLSGRFSSHDGKRVILLPTKPYEDEQTRQAAFDKARAANFEGLMIRLDGFEYESNKRSASLLKDKAVFDTEVIVKDIVMSDKGNPVCIADYDGKEFRISPPGGHSDRLDAYNNRAKRIGTRLTIEYREMTDDGIPFHAVATSWRTD